MDGSLLRCVVVDVPGMRTASSAARTRRPGYSLCQFKERE